MALHYKSKYTNLGGYYIQNSVLPIGTTVLGLFYNGVLANFSNFRHPMAFLSNVYEFRVFILCFWITLMIDIFLMSGL